MIKLSKIHLSIILIATIPFTLSSCDLLENLFKLNQDMQSSESKIRADKTVAATEDAFVRKNASSKNFGKVKKLKVKSHSKKEMQTLIKFKVPNISIVKAGLKIFVNNGSDKGPKIYKTSNTSWSENSITWNNKPGPSGSAVSSGSLSKGWQTIDITRLVAKNSTLSLLLVPDSSDGLAFKSKEKASNAPQLIIQSDGNNDGNDDNNNDGNDNNNDDNNNNNTGSGKFTVTSVSDDLDNSDGQDFMNGYKQLGYTFDKWDKNVSTSSLKGYLQKSQDLVYHTGHGSNGIIMTSNGSLSSNGLTIQAKHFIIATCLTLTKTSWKDTFGSNTKTIMGYTKVSFDKPVDNNLVSKYIQQLKSGNSHVVSWYKSNAAVSSLKDRWCAYSKEGSKVVEYSARTNNTPKRIFSGDQVDLYGNVTVKSSLLTSSDRFDRAYQVAAIDEILSPLDERTDRNTWPTTATSLNIDQARNIASNELANRGGLPVSARLERIIPIERCDDADICDTVAYQAYYVQEYDGYDLTSTTGTNYISLLIDDMGVSSMDIEWSQITPLDPGTDTYSMMDVGSALNIAGPKIAQLVRGNAVNIISYENVYGVQTDADDDKFLVPAYQFITETGELFVVSAITGELVF